jgi:hypothetical protein
MSRSAFWAVPLAVCLTMSACGADLDAGDSELTADDETGDEREALSVPAGTKLRYRVSFESGSTAASVGASKRETVAGDSFGGGTITVVSNPNKDARNKSARVGRHHVPAGYRRAELSSQRLPTLGKTYIYKWSYYLPAAFFSSGKNWDLVSQWKSYPCGKGSSGPQLCGDGGIFDDLTVKGSDFQLRYRTEPDCETAKTPAPAGEWVRLVMQIKWAKTDSGFARLYKNGELVFEKKNIKTLFNGFDPGRCDLYWAVGLYAHSDDGLTIYTDNIEIWE